MSPEQITAFEANSGFAPSASAAFLLGATFALLMLWGVWAMRAAYVGWSEGEIPSRQLASVAIRFLALYLGLSFFLLSRH